MTNASAAQPVPRFAALRDRDCRTYLIGGALAMMADNIEHVITYWVLWQRFHSPALVGFEVISHWLPFLFLSVWFGALADRFDCRRVVQAAQVLFMLVSIAWGVLLTTGALSVPLACVLLVLHGIAGALWGPGEQLLLQDFVGDERLPSAVRMNATFRSLGILFGPVVGSVLLIGLGPITGIFVNAAIYLPLLVFLFITKATGHRRTASRPRQRVGLIASLSVVKDVRHNPRILALVVLAGLGSLFIGQALQSAMPIFAEQWTTSGGGDLVYGLLLFGAGAGGVIGGFLLEVTRRVPITTTTVTVTTAVFGLATFGFAVTGSLVLAVVLLFVAGVANVASMSVGQTIVQLEAPRGERGRVIGLYGVAASGLRVGSGVTVGFVGAAIGVAPALAISCVALCVGTGVVGSWLAARHRAALRAV